MSNRTTATLTGPPHLPLIRIDPAADPNEPEKPTPDIREVSSAEDRAIGARVTSSPQRQGAAVVEACAGPLIDATGDQYTPQLDELALDLRAKFARIHLGDLADPEAMMFAQAQALQSLFSHLAVRALEQKSLSMVQMYLTVALKAQAQSRATLTALADLKHPRQPNFIGQQNVALNQQVSNSQSTARESEIEVRQIKLLEVENGERLDTGTTGTTNGIDQTLEAVGEIERPQDRRG